ncbi:hypothetical protein [Aminivibrio sp.]|uniref:hypothetical protein n=1 Tax=Aminivibrio sp. TaxID=1872489 RepID=UPI001A62D3B4|nr:hypothetical protein [Aminivibrio sp.]MBL3540294.1 hypothetical protein [Aminivibrio sp.]
MLETHMSGYYGRLKDSSARRERKKQRENLWRLSGGFMTKTNVSRRIDDTIGSIMSGVREGSRF